MNQIKSAQTLYDTASPLLRRREHTALGAFSWRLLPEFQLRSCGFSADLVLDFDGVALQQAAEREARASQDLDQISADLIAKLDTRISELESPERRRVRNALQNARKRLVLRQPLLEQDKEALESLGCCDIVQTRERMLRIFQDATEALEKAIEDSLFAETDRLVKTAQSGRFEEALFLSNPAFHGRIFRKNGPLERRKPKDFRHLLTLSRYARRFSTRNETVSFFGPTTFARLSPYHSAPLHMGPSQPVRTKVDCSTWVAQALLARASKAHPALERTVRQDPLWSFIPSNEDAARGKLRRGLDGQEVSLDADGVALWFALKTPHRLVEQAHLFDADIGRLRSATLALAPALRWGKELASTDLHALESLNSMLDDPQVDKLYSLARRMENAPWPELQEHYRAAEELVTDMGLQTSRRGGDHYADRTIFNMESTGPFSGSLVMGAPSITALQDALTDVLPLCALDGLLRRADARDALRKRLGGRDRPLLELLRDDTEFTSPRSAALSAALADLVKSAPVRDNTVTLSAQDLAPILTQFRATLSDEDMAPALCIPGIDVLANGTELDKAMWVLGEIHDDSSAVFGGSQARLGLPRGALYDRFAAELEQEVDVSGMATVLSKRRHKAVTPEMPGLTIEFTGSSSKDPAWCAPISEITVAACATKLMHRGRAYHLWPGDVSGALHVALALPTVKGLRLRLEDATPRVMIGGMVFQRAQWRVPFENGTGAIASWIWARTLRDQLGVPRWVYVRHDAEPKPFFVDLDNPLHLADLGKLSAGVVDIIEALPDPESLWWTPEDSPTSCELRIGTIMQFEAPGALKTGV